MAPAVPFTPMMHVQPGPVTSACKKLVDGKHVVIHFEHSTGATSLVVTVEFAKVLINQLQEVTGGIITATLDRSSPRLPDNSP